VNILVTVCARGGSKGVKNKNIRELAGKPLIAYTLELAKKWNRARNIVCSTDSTAIAKIALSKGIKVPFLRPAELATDTVGKLVVVRHALNECERIFNQTYDVVVDLDATSPVRSLQDLETCFQIFEEKKPDVLFSVVEARRNPYFNMVELKSNGSVSVCKEASKLILRRQDAPKVYDMNASIYFYNRNFLLDLTAISPLSTSNVAIHVMNDISAIDIDSELDWHFIEYLVKQKVISW